MLVVKKMLPFLMERDFSEANKQFQMHGSKLSLEDKSEKIIAVGMLVTARLRR